MFVWDGSDRQKGDEEAALVDALRRKIIMRNPMILAQMRDYVAAYSLALTGTVPENLPPPAPLITGGFTPNDDDRAAMCSVAALNGRDIIHINFRTIAPHTPTGMVTTIFLDDGKAQAHSRCGVVVGEGKKHGRLLGVHDDSDQCFSFDVRRGVKMTRQVGFAPEFTAHNLRRAESMIEAAIRTGAIGDTSGLLLAF